MNGKIRESPLACNMRVIEPGLRALHVANAGELFRALEEVRELLCGENGELHTFIFGGTPSRL